MLSSLRKLLNKEFVIGAIIVIIAIALFSYDGSKRSAFDGLRDAGDDIQPYGNPHEVQSQSSSPADYSSNDFGMESSSESIVNAPSHSALSPVIDPASLLPTDHNSDWAKLNPSMNAGATPDLLQAGYHIGLNTIGQTLKNPNLQIRSEPIIQKQDIGPWMQSTIEPDLGRAPLEIGGAGY